ncbi:helix-turn-helix domain-containing protein [Vallitalea pronyensis]|uniref:Helix-turn-helix domain-containing protein n=1 Tax=Vallitalea pronyensis TaxID=1348613 RepID=A0A8J8MHS5_9FIRM|nr:helix-turn-helix domain-containing protein [Vallitalea pronyensis]QUI21771.1 helix-turn-helix domain-containing protein [Vallitalea pronyensis]
MNKGGLKMDYSLTIWSVASFVETSVKDKMDYKDLEKIVGFSYRHIREVFKESTGISLAKYMLIRRISNTAFEIVHTKESLTEIAANYHFSSYDSFTRAFKRITGMMPSRFRKQSCKVGRRRLFMGMYAPVIYRDEEYFMISQPILEVTDKMKSVEKNNGTCILYGVPKVAYTYEECTPFPTVLKACLNYMGQTTDYAYIMAATGAAFRLRWNLNYWDGGNVDIMNVYNEPYKAFEKGFAAAGRSYKILTRDQGDKASFIQLITSEIDQGSPVIALGIIGPPEACVITGYQDNGHKILGWNCFQDNMEFNKGVTYHQCGYFICDNWWENKETIALMAIGEQQVEKTGIKEMVKNAIQIMTNKKITHIDPLTKNIRNELAGGQDAYDAWANAISHEQEFPQNAILPMLIERLMCQNDAQVMIAEGRSYAACFTEYIGKCHPNLAEKCHHVADLFRKEAKCAMDMDVIKGGFEQHEEASKRFADSEVRKKIVTLIQQAKAYDLQARQGLEEILEML